MNKFEELKQIFKNIIVDLGYTDEQVSAIVSIVRTPAEMTKIVDIIEKNQNITYEELFEELLKIIDFDIIINN